MAVEEALRSFQHSVATMKHISVDLDATVTPWNRKHIHSYDAMLTPFHNSLRIFGLLYKHHNDSSTYLRYKFNVGKWYHWFMVFLLWINFLRYFGAYEFGESFGLELSTKLIVHALLFWGASGSTAGTMMMTQRPAIFRKWQEYLDQYSIIHHQEFYTRQRRRVWKATTVSWFICLLYVAGMVYINFNKHYWYFVRLLLLPLVDICEERWTTSFPIATAFIILVTILNTTVCLFQLMYLLLMSLGVADEFEHYNSDFRSHIKINSRLRMTFGGDLEHWRLRHQCLCELTEYVDAGFGLYVMLVVVTNILVCSFLVYRIVLTMATCSNDDNFIPVISQLTAHIIFSFGLLLVIAYVGNRLNTEATLCKSMLYGLELSGAEWTAHRNIQYTTFYNKVSEGHIGITGWKLFYINKLTIKTVMLMIVSYSVILLKFGQTSPILPFHCPQLTQLNTTQAEDLIANVTDSLVLI